MLNLVLESYYINCGKFKICSNGYFIDDLNKFICEEKTNKKYITDFNSGMKILEFDKSVDNKEILSIVENTILENQLLYELKISKIDLGSLPTFNNISEIFEKFQCLFGFNFPSFIFRNLLIDLCLFEEKFKRNFKSYNDNLSLKENVNNILGIEAVDFLELFI